MTTNSILLTQLSPEQFRELLKTSLQEVLSNRPVPADYPKEEALWTADEIEQILGVPKVTLYLLRKNRKIASHRIGRKVYYKLVEVEKAMRKYNIGRA